MTESEATFALPAPLDPNGQPVAGDPASALLRAAPVSNAERWVTEADEQIRRGRLGTPAGDNRSEEHTSELQSLMRISYAVFCLKKKNKNTTKNITKT